METRLLCSIFIRWLLCTFLEIFFLIFPFQVGFQRFFLRLRNNSEWVYLHKFAWADFSWSIQPQGPFRRGKGGNLFLPSTPPMKTFIIIIDIIMANYYYTRLCLPRDCRADIQSVNHEQGERLRKDRIYLSFCSKLLFFRSLLWVDIVILQEE